VTESPATPAFSRYELEQLATYNSERARGLVHTTEWQRKMQALQARWHALQDDWNEALGAEGQAEGYDP